ncbi:hypothetical protein [Maribacter algicola]|uniref:hypothetical protein n=1 Tax=Maribacter algicola TaxID=2498892 RepID=UPI001FB49611|nr:hypothetical protein [Maribacter algicola]
MAEVVGTVGGFGSSVFFVPFGNFFFDFHIVPGLTALFHLFSNMSKFILFKKGLDKERRAIRGFAMAAFNLEKGVFITTWAFIDFFIDFTRTFVISKMATFKRNT